MCFLKKLSVMICAAQNTEICEDLMVIIFPFLNQIWGYTV